MANLLERIEELHRRVTEINRLDEEGQPETDALVRRVEALEREKELQWRCIRAEYPSGLLDRVEALEQRVPKPIPVAEPLASGDDLDEQARDCFERWRVDCSYRISDCERDVMLILARARVAKAVP